MLSATQRMLICAGIGLTIGILAALVAPWQFAVLGGWLVTGAVFVSMVWLGVRHLTADQVSAVATSEDTGRIVAGTVIVAAAGISLVGVVFGLAKAQQVEQPWRGLLIAVSIGAVVASWLAVHSEFALRYAHLYYRDDPGGIDFPGGEAPDYRDFGYLAFTLGMTFQVSDTGITSKEIRRTVTQHTLLSYVFGTFIIGAAINVMAGFIR